MRKSQFYRLTAMVLILTMTIAFSGCSTKEITSEAESTPTTDSISGGWSTYTEAEAQEIPEKANAAFEKATEQLVGADYTVAAYLGSQIVSGTNYAFLCNCTPTTADPVTSLKLVTIYEDLEEKAAVSDISDIDVTAYTQDKALDFEQLSGAFRAEEAIGDDLPADAQRAYDKATEQLTGVAYEPLTLLASQVVAGMNYAILCKATSMTADPITRLAVVTIYADPDSGAEITSICPFVY